MVKRIFSLILLLSILATSSACAKANTENDNDTSKEISNAETTLTKTEETIPDRAHTPDNLPADLKFDGTSINIFYFGVDDSKNYDAVGENSGDIVYDAVYNRNISVSDRLGVELNWIKGNADWNEFPAEVSKALLAGISDYDIILEENSRLFQQSLDGFYINLFDMPYLDYLQPWWYNNFMNEGNIDSSKRFFVTGDFAMTTLFGASVIYFNKGIFANNIGDVNNLYQCVLDGKWTHDVMMQYCRDIYKDINGDGAADEGDLFGFRFTEWGVPNHLSMSTGIQYTKREDNGFPALNLNTEEAVLWSQTLYKMMYRDNMSIESKKVPINDAFMQGNSLFCVGTFGTANSLRQTEFEYGIIPHPKFNESLDYTAAAATVNGNGAAIPTSAPSEKHEASCAVLEALCSESYRTVIPAWYDTALKIKYVAAEIDAQMVDLIYSKINTSFLMMADKTLGLGSIFTSTVYGSKTDGAFASYYATNESKMTTNWQKMIDKYLEVTG